MASRLPHRARRSKSFRCAAAAFSAPPLLLAAIGVGICSSVIPYICDQLAMSRLPLARALH
jgi:threonine/homoserine efflux transporter RhtA